MVVLMIVYILLFVYWTNKMYNIAITGHTSGLGLVLYQHFPQAIGFSRKNGYNLLETANIKSMINAAQDCDIFINNAFPAIAADSAEGMNTQLDILYKIYQRWEHQQNKLIINLGSNTSDGIKKHFWPYAAAKAATDKACEQLSYLKNGPSVCNLRFGYIDLPHINEMVPNEKKVSIKNAISAVDYIIRTFETGNTIRELTIIP